LTSAVVWLPRVPANRPGVWRGQSGRTRRGVVAGQSLDPPLI